MKNRTMLQGFEWYIPADGKHWSRLAEQAERLAGLGFTDIWLPPAYKGLEGAKDVGYGVYDLFDLGEFDQKGSVATKYGTKEEYLACIRALHTSKGRRIFTRSIIAARFVALRLPRPLMTCCMACAPFGKLPYYCTVSTALCQRKKQEPKPLHWV